jgi:hypothetical protein
MYSEDDYEIEQDDVLEQEEISEELPNYDSEDDEYLREIMNKTTIKNNDMVFSVSKKKNKKQNNNLTQNPKPKKKVFSLNEFNEFVRNEKKEQNDKKIQKKKEIDVKPPIRFHYDKPKTEKPKKWVSQRVQDKKNKSND